jgi:hypothetical protein
MQRIVKKLARYKPKNRKKFLLEQDITFRVRCDHQLHTIVLTKGGSLIFKNHPIIELQLMKAVDLYADMRCFKVFNLFTTHKTRQRSIWAGAPKALAQIYKTKYVVAQLRKERNARPLTYYGMRNETETIHKDGKYIRYPDDLTTPYDYYSRVSRFISENLLSVIKKDTNRYFGIGGAHLVKRYEETGIEARYSNSEYSFNVRVNWMSNVFRRFGNKWRGKYILDVYNNNDGTVNVRTAQPNVEGFLTARGLTFAVEEHLGVHLTETNQLPS